MKNKAVGAKHRGSNLQLGNREAVETAERLNEMGQTLRIERIFQQPVETVACELSEAVIVQPVREIEVVAVMQGPSRQLPQTGEELQTLYTNHGCFQVEAPLCDDVVLQDAAMLNYTNNAQVMGFRLAEPAEGLVSDKAIKRALNQRLQAYCHEYEVSTGFADLRAKVLGLVRRSANGKWPCGVLLHAEGSGKVLDRKTGRILHLSKSPGAVALLHDHKLLGRCVEPARCRVCIEGLEHGIVGGTCSNN